MQGYFYNGIRVSTVVQAGTVRVIYYAKNVLQWPERRSLPVAHPLLYLYCCQYVLWGSTEQLAQHRYGYSAIAMYQRPLFVAAEIGSYYSLCYLYRTTAAQYLVLSYRNQFSVMWNVIVESRVPHIKSAPCDFQFHINSKFLLHELIS